MSRLIRWAAIIATGLALAGCAESNAEVTTPPAPPDPAMVRAAEQVLREAPAPEPGWQIGVVINEREWTQEGLFFITDQWAIGVLTNDGMVQLTGRWCDEEPSGQKSAKDALPVLVDPADLVTWTANDAGEVCTSGLIVLQKAAAFVPAEPTP